MKIEMVKVGERCELVDGRCGTVLAKYEVAAAGTRRRFLVDVELDEMAGSVHVVAVVPQSKIRRVAPLS